jgi:P27 family predicted phage terminase small subunit
MQGKRKSITEHMLQGTFRADRHATPRLVYPPPTVTAPPKYLTKVARQEWNRVAPLLLDAGLLTEADLGTLAAYCTAFAGWRECAALIAEQGQIVQVESSTRTGRTTKPIRNPAVTLMLDYQRAMLAAAAKFGFSPYDRERIEGTAETEREAAHSAATDADDYDHSNLLAH